jgi:phosphoglycerate dehydrogenase-like enzyme
MGPQYDDEPPARWKIVSTATFPEDNVRRFVPAGTEADIVIVDPRTEDAAVEAVADADIVLGDYTFEIPLNRRVIAAMERCRLIQQPSVGYQQIDVDAATELGVTVANVAGANDTAVAEHTVMAALALMRELPLTHDETRAGNWPQMTRPHYELAGKTWGIIGFGRIGRQVAQRLQNWDLTLRYYDPFPADSETEQRLNIQSVELEQLLAESDVISLHLPLSSATRGLLGADLLKLVKPSAYLINVARGEIIDEPALVEALREQRLRGAALDVYDSEPLLPGHPLTELSNTILTPHIAGTTLEARIRVMKQIAANVGRIVNGQAPVNVLNPR